LKAVPRAETAARIVEQGDTLTKLSEDVYGRSDTKLIKIIQENNPQIANPNLIVTGSKIVFPEVPKPAE
jgi:nucleoid-associated protein YgaU